MKGLNMKLTTIALASVFALGPTLALAQAGGSNAGAAVPEKAGTTSHNSSEMKDSRTTGSGRNSGASTGSAITTGSDVPQDKPNLSNSPESSDSSQRVK
jgi:hypothetical protein